MNHGTKTIEPSELTVNLLRDEGCLIDNLFSDLWKHMGMKARLNRIGFPKRSGTSAHELVYCLMIWCSTSFSAWPRLGWKCSWDLPCRISCVFPTAQSLLRLWWRVPFVPDNYFHSTRISG